VFAALSQRRREVFHRSNEWATGIIPRKRVCIHFLQQMQVIIPLTNAVNLARHLKYRGFGCDGSLLFPWW